MDEDQTKYFGLMLHLRVLAEGTWTSVSYPLTSGGTPRDTGFRRTPRGPYPGWTTRDLLALSEEVSEGLAVQDRPQVEHRRRPLQHPDGEVLGRPLVTLPRRRDS